MNSVLGSFWALLSAIYLNFELLAADRNRVRTSANVSSSGMATPLHHHIFLSDAVNNVAGEIMPLLLTSGLVMVTGGQDNNFGNI